MGLSEGEGLGGVGVDVGFAISSSLLWKGSGYASYEGLC